MSIATAIQTAQQRIANAYLSVSSIGGVLPEIENLSNLPSAINSAVLVSQPFHIENGVLTRGQRNETSVTDKFSSITEIGWQGLLYSYFRCGSSLVGNANFDNLIKVGASGLLSAFASTSITGFSAPLLVEISSSGMKDICKDTLVSGEVRLPELTTVEIEGLKESFVRTNITKMYFNKLSSCHSTGLLDMLKDCTTCTEIHFKSGTQSLIQGLDGYSDKFGATNATIYFDL